jgi:hypothetical protein
MPIRLRFDGVNDVAGVSGAGITGNAGTGGYTFRVRFVLHSYPSAGIAGIIGTSATANSAGLAVTTTGLLRVYSAGINRYGTAGAIPLNELLDITVRHEPSGAWSLFDNIANSSLASGTFTSSTVFAALNQFGRSSSSSATYLDADIELIRIQFDSSGVDETWVPFLTQGGGSSLQTLSNTRSAALFGFPTDGSQWVVSQSGFSLGVLPPQGVSTLVSMDTFVGDSSQNNQVTICFTLQDTSKTTLLISSEDRNYHIGVALGGRLQLVSFSTVFQSGLGFISQGVKYWVRWETIANSLERFSISTDGVNYALLTEDPFASSTKNFNRLFLGPSGSVQTGVIHYLHLAGPDSGSSALFYGDTTNGAGLSWPSLIGTRTITLSNFAGSANSWWISNVPSSGGSVFKYHNGTAYIAKPLKYHNGTSWVAKPLKYHNGTGWV